MFKTEYILFEFAKLQLKICLSWEVQKVDKVGSGAGNHAFFPDPDSVADPGCLSRIPEPTFFHPGSRIRIRNSGSGSELSRKFRICNTGVLDIELPVLLKFSIFFKNNSQY